MVFSSSANYSDERTVFFVVCVFYQERETDRNHDRNTCKYVDRKRLGSHAGRLEVSRWRNRGEYEESIACRWQSTQRRDPPWLWNSGQRLPKVQKLVTVAPQKGQVSKKHNIKEGYRNHETERQIQKQWKRTTYQETLFTAGHSWYSNVFTALFVLPKSILTFVEIHQYPGKLCVIPCL